MSIGSTRGCASVIRRFLEDESGQSTVEYVVFLAMLIAVLVSVGRGVIERVRSIAMESLGPRVDRMFSAQGLYRYTLTR